jgi:hypothetical protein
MDFGDHAPACRESFRHNTRHRALQSLPPWRSSGKVSRIYATTQFKAYLVTNYLTRRDPAAARMQYPH